MKLATVFLSLLFTLPAFAEPRIDGSEKFVLADQEVMARYTDEGWISSGSAERSHGEKGILIIFTFEKNNPDLDFEMFMKASEKCEEFGYIIDKDVDQYRKDFRVITNRKLLSMNNGTDGMFVQKCLLSFDFIAK